jgi:CRISPR-associated protein Cmr1
MRKPKHDVDLKRLAGIWRDLITDSPKAAKVLLCETLTPLYGGGVRAGEVDPELPIRPSSLRGQWRFWWRLLNRVTGKPKELFSMERDLWGGVGAKDAAASKVTVRLVAFSKPDELTPAFEYEKRADGKYRSVPRAMGGVSAYALFPAQGTVAKGGLSIETEPKKIAKPGLKFELQIDCPDDRWPEVHQALRWWASFGGVGARTRRGLGAVKAVQRGAVGALKPVTPEEVAEIGGKLILGKRAGDAMEAWRGAVEQLREFRQGLGIGRQGTDPHTPGRTYWPEADAIRRLSNTHSTGHEPEHPVSDLYPRAAFGLPIVFHFKDENSKPSDPARHVLEPDGDFERLASPLILRPYWDGQGYRPAALLLPGWEQALRSPLKFKGTGHHGLETWPDDPSRRSVTANQIHPMKGQGDDPLAAFLEFFRKRVR